MLNFGPKSFTEIDEELLSDFLITETSKFSDTTKKNYRISFSIKNCIIYIIFWKK